MSVRSAGRGSAAARSIRLALRSLSIVATKSANFLRCVLRCRGSRRPSSASIPTASRAIPLMLHARQVDHGPRAARPLDGVNETDGWQGVRVVEYRLEGVAEAEPLYRLVTTILDPAEAPAA